MKIPFFFVGSCFGSLLNVICYRTLRNENFIYGRSRCNHCGRTLSFKDMIPVIGWILLKGRCRHCGEKISVKYPLTELITGIITVYLLKTTDYEHILCWIQAMTLILISLFDLETMEFPSVLTFILMLSGMIMSFLNDVSVISRITGALFLEVPLMILNRKKEMIGDGDVLIMMITGWTYGYEFLFRAVLVSSVSGLLYSLFRNEHKIPFCPFLAFGIIVNMLMNM